MTSDNKKVIAFITAAGTGTRMNLSIPKQFLTIDDVPVCFYLMKQIQENDKIDEIAIAIPQGWKEYVMAFANHIGIDKLKYIVYGGDTILASIRNMSLEVNKTNDSYVVCLNDGDRFIFDDVFNVTLENFEQNGNTISYFNPYDITFQKTNDSVLWVNRNEIMVTCTPHVYSSEDVNEALDYASKNDDWNAYLNQLIVKLGHDISFAKCTSHNLKVTYQEDLEVIRAMIHERKANGTSR